MARLRARLVSSCPHDRIDSIPNWCRDNCTRAWSHFSDDIVLLDVPLDRVDLLREKICANPPHYEYLYSAPHGVVLEVGTGNITLELSSNSALSDYVSWLANMIPGSVPHKVRTVLAHYEAMRQGSTHAIMRDMAGMPSACKFFEDVTFAVADFNVIVADTVADWGTELGAVPDDFDVDQSNRETYIYFLEDKLHDIQFGEHLLIKSGEIHGRALDGGPYDGLRKKMSPPVTWLSIRPGKILSSE